MITIIIRFGYVAISQQNNITPSKTATVSAIEKIPDYETRIYKLKKILEENLSNTLKILRYNEAYKIKVYRFTSKLVPLATHPIIDDWDYIEDYKEKFKEIGNYIISNNIRVSAHPDHYTVINSNNSLVFESSLKDLDYHNKIFNAMDLDKSYKIVTHVGGVYGNKEASIKRFIEGYKKLPKKIAERIILENDDKVYSAHDVLSICKELKIPMVLDVHHHNCNSNGKNIEAILKDIFDTWSNEKFPPKIHFSSPRSTKDFRSHSDNIDKEEFMSFIKIAKKLDIDFDVMLEAKNKDLALIKLVNELEAEPEVKIINEGEIEY